MPFHGEVFTSVSFRICTLILFSQMGVELFIQLVTIFGASVDEYIFPNKEVKKSSVRRRLDARLDDLDDRELSVIEATVNGLCRAKEPEE